MEVSTLDEHLATVQRMWEGSQPHIDVIKIDVEGFEWFVLQGARKTLRQHKPILLLEAAPANMNQANVSLEMLKTELSSQGYSCRGVGPEDMVCTATRLERLDSILKASHIAEVLGNN